MPFAALAAAAGALLRRWFGGGFFSAPRRARVAVALVSGGLVGWIAAGLPGLAGGVLAACAFLPGHGSYVDMGTERKPDNEWLRWPLNLIFGPEPPFTIRRDLTGLILNYSAFTIPAGAWLTWWGFQGWFTGVSGLVAALAYWSAARMGSKAWTVWGELGAGAAIFGALALA